MDPFSALFMGAVAIGSAASAKAKKKEANAAAAQAIQDSLAMRQDAAATRIDAEALRQEAAGVRLSASLAEDEAQAAEYNAQISEQNAQQIRLQYAENERRFRVKAYKERGSIRAGVGAAGIQLSGSALDVLAEAAETQELDALTIRHEGAVRRIAEENDAKLNRLRAGSSRRSAAGILEKAAFIETRADFTEQQAGFLEERASYVAGTAPKLRKAGTYRAIGELGSGAATLLGKLG